MFVMDYNALCNLVDRSLPGRTKWMQCVPVGGDGAPTEQGVGLAITAEHGPASYWYDVVYFSVVPSPEVTGADGGFLPGRGEDASDWIVELGYEEAFETIGEAVEEAKVLVRNLPQAGIFPSRERFEAALNMLDETDEKQALAGA
jgi:hypothetical protein